MNRLLLSFQIAASLIIGFVPVDLVSAAQVTKLYSISVNSSQLFELNATTGQSPGGVAISLAGKTVTGGTGLATDPTTGTLYALLKLSDAPTCGAGGSGGGKRSTLVTLAPTTGIATIVGSSNSGNTGDCFAGITFHTNGTLYGITGDGAATPSTLYTLNKTTGVRTFAKTLGNGGDGETIGFNPDNGLLYHASGNDTIGSPPFVQVFETINPANLAAAPINIPRTGGDYVEALALTYKGAGVFLVTDGAATGSVTTQLLTMTIGGVISSVGSMDHPSKGLAFVTTTETNLAVLCPIDSVQSAVDIAAPGDSISVTGSSCDENIVIRNEKQKLTIHAPQGAVFLNGVNPNTPTLTVRGKGILIRGFNITGGSIGVHVNRGSNAVIDGNAIGGVQGPAIVVDQLAFAVITNNLIISNGAGIVVSENSTARIGFNLDGEAVASGNEIGSNDGPGIVVMGASSARIVGNDVSNSFFASGIVVTRDSMADIANNVIQSNNGDGIEVSENSAVFLGEATGSSIFELPNDSDPAPNFNFGIRCLDGGVAAGRLGSLSGNNGHSSFASSCASEFTL